MGKRLLWICKKLFPKKYYIMIFRGSEFSVHNMLLFLAADI
ncbi:DNA-binding protein [Bacillus cereus]|uniref:DNA-binding protein n=1 Tax=Bacillus cereus TaxID=1396 RepID=A0A2A8PXL5_BACCE|nr:DNA-binding protein [Bacillus cereus]